MKQYLSNPPQIGQVLLSARKSKGLTQAEAGARLGVSQSRLSVLESDPAAMTLEQLLGLIDLYDLRLQVLDKASASAAAGGAEW